MPQPIIYVLAIRTESECGRLFGFCFDFVPYAFEKSFPAASGYVVQFTDRGLSIVRRLASITRVSILAGTFVWEETVSVPD